MSKIWVARRTNRIGLGLEMGQSQENPILLFPLLPKTDPSELDELVRNELEKQGITKESEVQTIVNTAEAEYEYRVKVQEARKEVRRLMALRAEGKSLMQVGNRKWKEVYYPRNKGGK